MLSVAPHFEARGFAWMRKEKEGTRKEDMESGSVPHVLSFPFPDEQGLQGPTSCAPVASPTHFISCPP